MRDQPGDRSHVLLCRIPGALCKDRRFKSAVAQLAVIRVSHGAFNVVGTGPHLIIPHFDELLHFACQRSARYAPPMTCTLCQARCTARTNWGYRISDDQVQFAHQLVDAGIDIVHGHSSHHPRPIEILPRQADFQRLW
ncbi:CapA family protein [Arthrobacter sp. H14]|uniref:CapA family protein n=1 Tax=Arthrobacter sp. H14 TaxID=1312959 RepID=UPI003FA4B79D